MVTAFRVPKIAALVAALLLTAGLSAAGGAAVALIWLGQPGLLPLPATPAHAAPALSSHSPVAPRLAADCVDITALFRQVAPAVVTVSVASRGEQGQGSGVIVDAEGHILTNAHVVDGVQEAEVVLDDQTRLTGRVVGRDALADLAVLQASIPEHKLTAARLGDSDAVVPGEPAIAIGNAFGFAHSITSGIISGVGRRYGRADSRSLRGMIQTDAAINPGNSGGPLLNAHGEVIGINTLIESPVRGSVGVGFAIPINRAKRLLPRLLAGEAIEYPWLGIAGTPLTKTMAAQADLLVSEGVVVRSVVPESPAERAGLRPMPPGAEEPPAGADVIVAVDGRRVSTVAALAEHLESLTVGDIITLTVLRDGERISLEATLAAWPTRSGS